MTAYYHVLLSLKSTPDKTRCILWDLSEAKLQSLFLAHYRAGTAFMCANEVIETTQIQKVTIILTAQPSEAELREMDNKSHILQEQARRSSGAVFISLPADRDDLAGTGTDVTERYITSPPGSGRTSLLQKIAGHPWITAIVTTVAAGGILWLLGWN